MARRNSQSHPSGGFAATFPILREDVQNNEIPSNNFAPKTLPPRQGKYPEGGQGYEHHISTRPRGDMKQIGGSHSRKTETFGILRKKTKKPAPARTAVCAEAGTTRKKKDKARRLAQHHKRLKIQRLFFQKLAVLIVVNHKLPVSVFD